MSDDKALSTDTGTPKAPISPGRQIGILVAALVFAGLLSIGFYQLWTYERLHPSTDDAYLHAHYVWISPQLNGQISRLFVEPNQFVKESDPLFEIDPRQYQQDLTKAANQLLLVRHDVEADKARVDSARARLIEEQAELKTAEQYARRFQKMVKSGAAAELDTIHYVNALIEAKGRVAEARAALDEALINQAAWRFARRGSQPRKPTWHWPSSIWSGPEYTPRQTATSPSSRRAQATWSNPRSSCSPSSSPRTGGWKPTSRRRTWPSSRPACVSS